MPVLLTLVLLVVVEITGMIVVGQAIGVLGTLALLAAAALLGAALLRRLGMQAVTRLSTAARGGPLSPREIGDGLFVAMAAVLLITPGFVTDAFAVLLLLPPVRALLRKTISTRAARRVTVIGGAAGRGPTVRRRPSTRVDRDVIDGEIVSDRDAPRR